MSGNGLNIERPTQNVERRKKYDLEDRLLKFSANIICIAERLPATRAGNHVAGQLLRSGTSPLPNHAEAQAAESRADFIHKFKIGMKELRETERWLRLIQQVPLLQPASQVTALLSETDSLIRVFKSSIQTAERNGARRPTSDVQRSVFKPLTGGSR